MQRLSNELGKRLQACRLYYTYLLRIRRILSPYLSNGVGRRVELEMKIFADAYPAAYRTLYEAKSVTCSVSGTLFDAIPAPCAVILDVSLLMFYARL
jgi:hypothetical protein